MLLLAIVLGSLGLGWVFKTIIIAIALSIVLPIVAWFVLRWWLQKNLVQDKCPVCNYEFTGFGKTEFNCPSCGEPLKVESGKFKRITPPGTIEVEAVDVVDIPSETIEDNN